MKQLMGVPELARRLGKDQSTIHRRIHRGELVPAAYAGKQPLFTESDALALACGEGRPLGHVEALPGRSGKRS